MKKIVLIATLLVFVGCSSDESKKEPKQIQKQEVVKEVKKEVVTVEKVEEVKPKIVEQVVETKPELKVVIEEKAKEEVQKVVEEKIEVKVVQEKEIKEIKEKVKQVVATGKSGEEIFKACTACHGAHAEKAALGKSKIIKAWAADKTLKALHGYKDGTYGGAMKGLMKGQAGFLSDEEMKTVSEYISKL